MIRYVCRVSGDTKLHTACYRVTPNAMHQWTVPQGCSLSQGGAEGLSESSADKAWSLPLGAAVLAVRQLGLSGWEHAECFALENELGAWQQAGKLADPVNALR